MALKEWGEKMFLKYTSHTGSQERDLTHYQTTNFKLFQTESLQTTISNLMKMAEGYPNR